MSVAEVLAVARCGAPVSLDARARGMMAASADVVMRLVESPQPAYGVSTGFGSLANVVIPAHKREQLQRRLVRSHAAGMGPPVEREVVRAMMLLRARALAMGYSGARAAVVARQSPLSNSPCIIAESGGIVVNDV